MGGGNEAHSRLYPFSLGIINRGPNNGLHLVVIIGVWKVDKFSAAIDNYVKGFDFQRKPVSLFAAVGNICGGSVSICAIRTEIECKSELRSTCLLWSKS
ncbi:hypothetical protein TNCV_3916991 [Trichonephila clavipes]|nr:hypothetical protein TNCV_3916991 [Trichonephila clavipes]